MAFTNTKQIGSFALIKIDDVDVSNSFRSFGYSSEHADEPAGGFNSSGIAETLAGQTTQSFTGEAFYTEELSAILEPLHRNRTVTTVSFQPDGLRDTSREIYYGECYITTFGPANEFGSVATMPFTAIPADANGIRVTDWT